MGYRDPKAEGPAAYAASALSTLLAVETGANDVQLLSILAELVKDAPSDHRSPTQTVWTRWLNTLHTRTKRAHLSPARSKSVHDRLDKAAAGVPSARLWFALTAWTEETTSRLTTLHAYLDQIARIAGRDVKDVHEEFAARTATVGTARSNGDGRQTRQSFHGSVPADFATVTVLADMRREAQEAAGATPLTRTVLNDGPCTGYGYDPATNRLEVEMAGAVYAYRVPTVLADKLSSLNTATDEASTFLVRHVISNPAYAWLPGQKAVRVCPACEQPVGQVHQCAGPADAPYLTPVLVDLDPGAERIADDGTVVVVLDTLAARRALTAADTVDVQATVIIRDEATGLALGSRHVVSGTVSVGTDSTGTTGLACSCPAPRCIHLARAGLMVHDLVVFGTLPD